LVAVEWFRSRPSVTAVRPDGRARAFLDTVAGSAASTSDRLPDFEHAADRSVTLRYAANGELEAACQTLGDTFTDLAAIGNLRGIERARRARQRLRPWEHERPVRHLDERIDSLSVH
jgi:hypothetical protein